MGPSWTALAFSVFAVVSGFFFTIINRTRPEPYMDEIFHVPQAQRYCQGRYTEWDPKITTPPGLYFITIGMLNPLAKASAALNESFPGFLGGSLSANRSFGAVEPEFCTTMHLRAINVILSLVTVLILNEISKQIHGDKHYFDENKLLTSSMNLGFFPLLFFFSFFYYTDVGSTFLVLFMYCLSLKGKNWMAGFIGLLSVCFRQTNIVWVAFVALQSLAPLLIHTVHMKALETSTPSKFSLTTTGQVRELAEGFILLLCEPRELLNLVLNCLWVAGGYLIVWLIFLVFLVWNGEVALGDRDAHKPTFHPTQVLYFCGFSLAMSAPYCVARFRAFMNFASRRYITLFLAIVVACGIVDAYTLAHPYLLADNRHYTFYIWRRLLTRNSWMKFAAVPFYVYGAFCVLHSLRRTNVIFKLTFPLFVAINLTPQLLLEFRYFVVPFLLYRLQVKPNRWWKIAAESAIFLAVNAFTLTVFVWRPFKWEHDPSDTQRIIW